VLLNYASYYGEQQPTPPTPRPTSVWMPLEPPRRKKRVSLAINGELPGLETYSEARVRHLAAVATVLWMIALDAELAVDRDDEEVLLLAGALFLLELDDEEEDDDE
jgi:hypothetical protein